RVGRYRLGSKQRRIKCGHLVHPQAVILRTSRRALQSARPGPARLVLLHESRRSRMNGRSSRRLARPVMALIVGASVVTGSPSVTVAQTGTQNRTAVKMLTLNPLDVLYVFLGGGGNSLALVRTDEIVIVDAKLPGFGRAVLETVQAVSDRPI